MGWPGRDDRLIEGGGGAEDIGQGERRATASLPLRHCDTATVRVAYLGRGAMISSIGPSS